MVLRPSRRINDREVWMRHPTGVSHIPSRDGVGEVDIREEKMNAVNLPQHLQRAGSDGGLQHDPPLLAAGIELTGARAGYRSGRNGGCPGARLPGPELKCNQKLGTTISTIISRNGA